MKPLGLNLKNAKKIHSDKDSSTFQLNSGHQIKVLHSPLSALHRKQIEKMPIHKMAEGGDPSSLETLQAQDKDPAYMQQQAEKLGLTQYGDDQSPSAAAAPIQQSPAEQPDSDKEEPEQVKTTSAAPLNPMQAQQGAFEAEKKANLEAAGAQAEQAKQEGLAIGSTQSAIQALPTQQQLIQRNAQSDYELMNAFKNQKINPDQYWEDHSKIAAGIGLLLSGAGSHATGGRNLALDTINNGINREIDRQKNSQNQAMTLWGMNRQALGNDLAANLATQNQLYTGLKYKIEQTMANAKGPIALANAHAANAKIDQALMSNNFKLSLMNPTSDNPDPASRVQFLVPPERQQKVFDEIDAAKDTVANAQGILESFDQAAKEVRPMTGGLHTSPTAFIPGMRSSGQSALIARMGPTFKDVEGTVRQAAMDNMEHNVTPQFGDSDERIASRRQSLVDYLKSKSSAATAKGFGIDLSKFPSTSIGAVGHPGGAGAKPMPAQIIQRGHTYNLNPKTGKYE